MSDAASAPAPETRQSRIVRLLIAPVIILVVLGMLARAGCLGPVSDLVGAGDLERLRAHAILDPPPGATEIGREEQRTMQTFGFGRVDGHVYVLYASPQSQAELVDYFIAAHGSAYRLENVPASSRPALRGCQISDCRNNAVSIIIDGGPQPIADTPQLEQEIPAGTKSFALVRVTDPIP